MRILNFLGGVLIFTVLVIIPADKASPMDSVSPLRPESFLGIPPSLPQVATDDGFPQLSLPYATYTEWHFLGLSNGEAEGEFSALAFLPLSVSDCAVRAAADGSASREDDTTVVIEHDNGWWTKYGGLSDIPPFDNTPVQRGEIIGYAINGGVRTVLVFEIYRDDGPQSIIGRVIGGWLVEAGEGQHQGCMVRLADNYRVCAGENSRVYNDGTIGDPGKEALTDTPTSAPPTANPTTPPPADPTTAPAPTEEAEPDPGGNPTADSTATPAPTEEPEPDPEADPTAGCHPYRSGGCTH